MRGEEIRCDERRGDEKMNGVCRDDAPPRQSARGSMGSAARRRS
jgi:hypothetical protein